MKKCIAPQRRNPLTNRCKKPRRMKRCKTPQRRNPETNRCKKPCRKNQATNPRTKRCVLKTYLESPYKPRKKKASGSKKATSKKATRKKATSKKAAIRPSLRRSSRVPGSSALQQRSVVSLLKRIRENADDTVVLKLHNYIPADASTAVIDAVLEALMHNTKCQALYIQNFSNGCRDKQVKKLVQVLRRGHIWALNVGENYNVTVNTWTAFAKDLESTNVTHAYLSEHRISTELKKAIMDAIRRNRLKHTNHSAIRNIKVIRQVTHMWWNPIRSKKLQAQL